VSVLLLVALSFFSLAPFSSLPWALYSFRVRAIVKTAEPEAWPSLQTEFDAYQKPNIKGSPFIRAFYDHINEYKAREGYPDDDSFNAAAVAEPFALVLEYMDVTLENVDVESNKRRPEFMEALYEAHLRGTRDMHKAGLMLTGT